VNTQVDEIVIHDREAQAKQRRVSNPPKVLFRDQHGCDVQQNPGSLEVLKGGGGGDRGGEKKREREGKTKGKA